MSDKFELDPQHVAHDLSPGEVEWGVKNETPEDAHRSERNILARRQHERGGADLRLAVRCSSMRRKRPCRSLMAELWTTDAGTLARFKVMPFTEGALSTLDLAAEHAAAGRDTIAARGRAASTTEPLAVWQVLEELDPRAGGEVLMGCPEHGNVLVSATLLLTEARSARHNLSVDTVSRLVR